MTRSSSILAAALGVALAGPALAQDYVGGITGQLRDLGFEQIEVRQTLLGRARIIARSADGQREIILNPNNGEILRDFWQAAPGQSAISRLVDNRNSGASDRSGRDDTGNAGSDDSNDGTSGSDDSNDGTSGSDGSKDGTSGSDGSNDNTSGSDDSNSESSGSSNGNDDRSGSDDRDGKSGSDDDGSDDSSDDSDDSSDDSDDSNDDSRGGDSDDSSDD
jgi:hypothetical protein